MIFHLFENSFISVKKLTVFFLKNDTFYTYTKPCIYKAFIHLQFEPGEAMQVDKGEATVYLNGQKTVINLFCVRLCYSCRPVVLAYRHQNEESFLDAFVRTFDILERVPHKVIFDNGKVAVKNGFGKHALAQKGYTALAAHYSFSTLFCNPAGRHKKRLVEGLVRWARRNILVPVPCAPDIFELKTLLLERCMQYEAHQIKGKPNKVGVMMAEERPMFHSSPRVQIETAKSANVRVNAFSTTRFRINSYSVPVQYTDRMVGVKGYPETVEIYYKGALIAVHTHCYGRHQSIYHLEHYMPILEERMRAIPDATPVSSRNSGGTSKKQQQLFQNDPHSS